MLQMPHHHIQQCSTKRSNSAGRWQPKSGRTGQMQTEALESGSVILSDQNKE